MFSDDVIQRDGLNVPYTIIANQLLQNKNMTWNARAVMGLILSMPEDWVFYKSWVMKQGNLKRDAFNKVWKELQRFGYIEKQRIRDKDGRFTKEKREFVDKETGEIKTIEYGTIWIMHHIPIEVAPEVKEEAEIIEKTEEKLSEATHAIQVIAEEKFEKEFEAIETIDLLEETEKEAIKDEMVTEFEEIFDPTWISNNFQRAWTETMARLKRREHLVTYLTNTMQNNLALYRLEQAKQSLDDEKLKNINIPIDGPWNGH